MSHLRVPDVFTVTDQVLGPRDQPHRENSQNGRNTMQPEAGCTPLRRKLTANRPVGRSMTRPEDHLPVRSLLSAYRCRQVVWVTQRILPEAPRRTGQLSPSAPVAGAER